MKRQASPPVRSFLAAMTAVATTTLLAASFVGSTQSLKWLGSSTPVVLAAVA